jgi:dTDP-glucose 4,6-dehydratase
MTQNLFRRPKLKMAMRKGPILVTGGAGFIGSHLVRHLLARGERVVNLDILTYAGARPDCPLPEAADRYRFVHGSVCDLPLLLRLLGEHDVPTVLHLAAESHVDRSIDGPSAFVQTNMVGGWTMVEAFRQVWQDRPEADRAASRLIFVSTDEVYGDVAHGFAADGSPYAPSSPYAASKAGGDLMARAYARTYGLPVVVTHGSNTYGPRQFPEKLIPLSLLNALEGRPIGLYGDGLQQRDWIHVDDHCRGILAALAFGRPGAAYPLGSGVQTTNQALIGELCARLDHARPRADGRGHGTAITHVADRPGHDRRYALDSAASLAELGWRAEIGLSDGLAATIGWYLDNPDWWSPLRQSYGGGRLGLGGKG